jgi:isoamylase
VPKTSSTILGKDGKALLDFTRRLIALRRDHIVFHRSRFLHGQTIPGTEVKDMIWLRPDGAEMSEQDWGHPQAKALGVRFSGEAGLMHLTERGDQEPNDTFLVLMNASNKNVPFRLPKDRSGAAWRVLIDTRRRLGKPPRSLPRPQKRWSNRVLSNSWC